MARKSRRRPRTPREVFLSHASSDRRFASKLAATLSRHRIPIWYSRKTIKGAQQWHDEIGKALARCDWFLLVLSPAAARSAWVKRELLYALQQQRYRDRTAPLMYRRCKYGKLSWTLDSIQRIDFTKDFARGYRELLDLWGVDVGLVRAAPR